MAIAAEINYRLLADALDFYQDLGYERIEVPWSVARTTMAITAPARLAPQLSDGSVLAGSAEQGFLEIELNRFQLPPGKYCAITPCFRWGDTNSELHQEYFMKVELYRTDNIDKYAIDEMFLAATEFMRQQLRNETFSLERIETPEQNGVFRPDVETMMSADLLLNGIEVGSYGVRTSPDLDWVYGTGVAEPRFSVARSRPNYDCLYCQDEGYVGGLTYDPSDVRRCEECNNVAA